MRKSKLFVFISLISIGFGNYSCSNIPISIDEPRTSIQSPQNVDKKYVESFDPTYKVGMKYTYSVSSSNSINEAPEISSTEILEVNGDLIKVRLISSTRGSQEKTGKIAEFDSGLPENGIISEGAEDVTVPAGQYNGAVKISCFVSTGPEGSPKTKSTIWLVKDIGAVKRVDILPDASILTTELKEFKS